jgi:limonene-1,2-epoxide hydrolase
MATAASEQGLGVVVAWLDAMRRGEPEAAAECFHADVIWHGLPADAVCRSRAEVLEMLRRTVARGLPRAEAVELIAGDRAVALGVRSPDLRAIGDVPLAGQLYNVFELRDGVIAFARDFARREDALRAAQADAPVLT